MNVRELRAQLDAIIAEMRQMVEVSEKENRDLNAEEQPKYDELKAKAEEHEKRIKRIESMPELPQAPSGRGSSFGAPAYNRIGRGDNEARAMAHYIRTGDMGGVRSLIDGEEGGKPEVRVDVPTGLELRAVDSIMNITTAADGGAAVPTGFSGKIALRRNEIRLAEKLGIQMVPGKGTTVNYPYENADPSVFAATSEQADNYANTYERDVAPVLANKAFTLAKKTKKLALTEELLDDEDANLLSAAADTIGRAIGVTHNTMLITEVAANGTSFKTFASATVIAAPEIEAIVFNDTLGYYFDDGGAMNFVIRPSTHGEIVGLTGNTRQYAEVASASLRTLLGYPVHYSNQAGLTAASAKSVYFGNWYYVGMREEPALRFIRDPYTTDGIVYLKYSFRAVYGVLIAGAIGFGVHPSA